MLCIYLMWLKSFEKYTYDFPKIMEEINRINMVRRENHSVIM